MKNRMITFFVLLLINLSLYPQVSDSIVLGTVENLPPFSYTENGKLVGIDIDVLREIEKLLQLKIEIRPMPWTRVINELQNGSIDGAFSLYMNESRKSYCSYIEIVHYDNLGFLVMKGKEFSYNGIHNLYEKRIGKGAGVFISDEFEKAVEQHLLYVEEVNDTQMSNIRKLKANRIDVAIGVIETMHFFAKQIGLNNEVVSLKNYIEVQRPGYLVLSKKSKYDQDSIFKQRLADAAKRTMSSDKYQKMKNEYYNVIQ
jgi:polar amino acid transport system substrate-binding protein